MKRRRRQWSPGVFQVFQVCSCSSSSQSDPAAGIQDTSGMSHTETSPSNLWVRGGRSGSRRWSRWCHPGCRRLCCRAGEGMWSEARVTPAETSGGRNHAVQVQPSSVWHRDTQQAEQLSGHQRWALLGNRPWELQLLHTLGKRTVLFFYLLFLITNI